MRRSRVLFVLPAAMSAALAGGFVAQGDESGPATRLVPVQSLPPVSTPSVSVPNTPAVQTPNVPGVPVNTPDVPAVQTPHVPSTSTPPFRRCPRCRTWDRAAARARAAARCLVVAAPAAVAAPDRRRPARGQAARARLADQLQARRRHTR